MPAGEKQADEVDTDVALVRRPPPAGTEYALNGTARTWRYGYLAAGLFGRALRATGAAGAAGAEYEQAPRLARSSPRTVCQSGSGPKSPSRNVNRKIGSRLGFS